MKTKICPTCQQSNSSHALMCSGCGESLNTSRTGTVKVPENFMGVSQADHFAHITEVYKKALVLFVLDEKDPIIIQNIDKYVILGRPVSPADNVSTVDLTRHGAPQLGVSRQHVKITPAYNGYSIQDLGSTNGTWLNEIRLTPHSLYILRNGDQLRMGQMNMNVYFELGEPIQDTIFLIDQSKDTESLSRHALTANDLSSGLSPFLRALNDLQQLVDEIIGRASFDIGINRINVSKPGNVISINIDGARDAVELLRHHIIPWKFENNNMLKIRDHIMLDAVKDLALMLITVIRGDNDLDEVVINEFAGQMLPIIQALLLSPMELTNEQALPQA